MDGQYNGWPLRWKRDPIEQFLIEQFRHQGITMAAAAFLAAHAIGVDWNAMMVTTAEALAMLGVGSSTMTEMITRGWLHPAVDKYAAEGGISTARVFWRAEVEYLLQLRRTDPPGRSGPNPWEPEEPDAWPVEWGRPWELPIPEPVIRN